jgi:hypothetical protein
MDDVDRADQQIEQTLAAALAKAKRNAPASQEPRGECYFCGEPVAPGMRWCDVFCRDRQDYESARRRFA